MIATLQSIFDGFYCHDDRSRIPVKPKIIHSSRTTLRFHVLLLFLIISLVGRSIIGVYSTNTGTHLYQTQNEPSEKLVDVERTTTPF